MSTDDDVDGTLPTERNVEYDIPTAGGSGYTGGVVTTTLIDGETTLALNRWRDDVALTIQHDDEDDALQIGASANVSVEALRELREAIDEVLAELEDDEEHIDGRVLQ